MRAIPQLVSAPLHYITLNYIITLRQGLQNVTIIPRATVRAFLHRPSPPLSLKACRDCMQRRKSFSFKFVCAYLV